MRQILYFKTDFYIKYSIVVMDLVVEQITKEGEQLIKLNQQLKNRAEKFGAEFVPLTLTDYKLFKIRKARETGNIQYLDNILLEEIQDLQQRKQKISQRLQQFFPELKVKNQNEFFQERENPNLNEGNVQFRQNAWYLFGVDYMSNELIRNYFHINPHFRIEWINDSSCNIIFNSPQQAQESVLPLIKGEGMKDQSDIWYELPQYEVDGVRRKLYCRNATTKDVKKQTCDGRNSKYYNWMINKQKFGQYVKKKAHYEIAKTNYASKTKNISRDNKYHRSTVPTKKEQEEDNSSSGVDDSEQMNE